MVLEVADDRVHARRRRTRAAIGGRGVAQRLLAHVEGHEARERVRRRRTRRAGAGVFSDVPEPSSTSVSALVSAAMSAACATRMRRSVRVG